jgi:predicted ArsR family transcriptional regulator
MGGMAFTTADTVRERARRALAAADRPLTAAGIADSLGTTPAQVQRGLRQLEAQGAAVRERGEPWATPDHWHARIHAADTHAATSSRT